MHTKPIKDNKKKRQENFESMDSLSNFLDSTAFFLETLKTLASGGFHSSLARRLHSRFLHRFAAEYGGIS